MSSSKKIGARRLKQKAFQFQRPKVEVKCLDIPLTNLALSASTSVTSGTFSTTQTGPWGILPALQFYQGAAASVWTLLNGVRMGGDFFNRVGRQILMKSLEIVLCIVPHFGHSTTKYTGTNSSFTISTGKPWFDMGRIMIVYDRQTNAQAVPVGGLPAGIAIGSSLLQSVTADGGLSSGGYDWVNLDNRDRWGVIKDWRMLLPAFQGLPLDPATATTFGGVFNTSLNQIERTAPTFFKKQFIKLGGLETTFNSERTNFDSRMITTGALWLITCGSFQQTGGYEVLMTSRLRFIDP